MPDYTLRRVSRRSIHIAAPFHLQTRVRGCLLFL